MLISKHFDPVLGIDIHILVIPPAGPIPIPHPHIALIFDVIDYVPILGATVKVGGLPRSTAGTAGRPIPHIPMGGPFAKPPMNEDEIFMGSLTVLADGGPLSFTALPTLSCHDIGLIAPPRKKKPKKSFGMVLPTSVVISIPLGMPVMVGGAPTIDMMGLAMMGGFAALGGAFKKLRKMQKKSKRIKKMSDAIHKRAKKAMDKLGVPPNVRNKVHKGICTVTGHPVDVATGKMFTDHIDFSLPGPLPLVWERTWYSTSVYDGPLGHGWHHSYDVKLCEMDNAVAVRMADGRSIAFPALDINETCFDRQERMTLFRDDNGYALDTKDKQRYRFTPFNGQPDNQLLTSLSQTTSGAAIKFYYNEKGLLNKIIDSGNRLIQLSYTDDNRIHKIFLPEPESNLTRDHTTPTLFCAVEHHYRDGMLVQVDDALQQPLRYHYDHKLLIKETFRSGLSFYFEYDQPDHNARCLRTWGDEGIYYREIRYDLENNITRVKSSLGYVTTYYHDGVLPYQIVDARYNVIRLEHNEYAQLRSETNQLGQKTRYSYDISGNLIKVGNADGTQVELMFDEYQQLVEMIDPAGNNWRYEYDTHARLKTKTDPMGCTTHYEYTQGILSKIIDAAGNKIQLRYDQNLNLSGISDGKNESASFQYDAMGNLLAIKDNRGNRRNFSYDKLGRVGKIEESDGNVRKYAYDKTNNIIRVKDRHYEVFLDYCGMGRIATRTHGNTTLKFDYDTEEQLRAITNEHGHVYQLERDANGEIITESGFDGIQRQFIRDPAGRPIRLNRPDQRCSTYSYDAAGRVRHISHNDGSYKSFEFRADGQLIKASTNTSTLSWELDALGRVVKENQDEFWVAYEYDNLGYRTRVQSSMGLDQTITRNKNGDVLQISAGENNFNAIFERDSHGSEIQRNLPGGIKSRWVRDKLGRPLRHEITQKSDITASKSYVWGLNNRLVKLIDSLSRETLFQHDAFGNLLSARYTDNTFDLRAPDAIGNLFQTLPQKDREYGPAGQLLAIQGQKGITRYEYDAEGNLIRKEEPGKKIWHYTWNGSGALAKVIRPDGKEIHFKYDALGRRTHKINGDKITRWIWDHNNPLHEWIERNSPVSENQRTFQSLTDNESIHAETRLTALQPIIPNAPPNSACEGSKDQPITWLFEPDTPTPMARLLGQDHHSIVTDHLGVPNFIFDKTGKQIWAAEISIWGELRNLKGDKDFCPFRFPGQYEDSETGLYYNRFRYYDAQTGHYISQDPIKLAGGISAYAYAKDTTIGIDSLGLTDETSSDPLTDGLRQETESRINKTNPAPTKGQLRRDAALSRASVDDLGIVTPDYTNLPGSVKNFPGVEQVDELTFKINDKAAFMNEIERVYGTNGANPLNSTTKGLILDHIGDGSRTFPTHAGIPGLHAEVQAFNNIMNRAPDVELSKIKVATFKLAPGNGQGKAFGACSNCGGILPKSVNILTGIKAV